MIDNLSEMIGWGRRRLLLEVGLDFAFRFTFCNQKLEIQWQEGKIVSKKFRVHFNRREEVKECGLTGLNCATISPLI